MKKLLFIDHSFHKKTRSADFFVEILRKNFAVEVYYLTPEDQADAAVLAAAADADIVFLWQMDFLAPVFLAMGKPTIVAPMFDGSGGMPDMHWLFAGSARFVNFSLLLHQRIRMLGIDTLLVRYFPEAVDEGQLPRFDRLNAFFWQRRPDHGVRFDYFHSLIGADLNSFHLHNAPDVPDSFPTKVPEEAGYRFTESSWFKEKADYEACLGASNVFIAPRAAEGIGMALLEAMARGMVVLAHDAPTNNEYVSNGINGILFNKDAEHAPISLREDAARLGRSAWRTVVEGRRQWLESHPAIRQWVDQAKAVPALNIDLQSFFRDLWHSYYASLDEYELFLLRHVGLLPGLSGLPFATTLELIGSPIDQVAVSASVEHQFPALKGGLLDLVSDNRYVGAGWSSAEPGWRWAVGTSAQLHFDGLENFGKRIRVRFAAAALPELGRVKCAIILNGKKVFDARVRPGWRNYEFAFGEELLRGENQLLLEFDKAMALPTDKRELSVCFKSFEFQPDAETPASGMGVNRLTRFLGRRIKKA